MQTNQYLYDWKRRKILYYIIDLIEKSYISIDYIEKPYMYINRLYWKILYINRLHRKMLYIDCWYIYIYIYIFTTTRIGSPMFLWPWCHKHLDVRCLYINLDCRYILCIYKYIYLQSKVYTGPINIGFLIRVIVNIYTYIYTIIYREKKSGERLKV